MKQLKKFADTHELSVLVIHHTRKDNNPNDPFSNISGTNGITGACDTMMVFTKEERSSNQAKLSITGRDVDQQDLMLTMRDCKWNYEGTAEDIKNRDEELTFRADPFFNTINDLLLSHNGKWEGTCQEILNHADNLGFKLIESEKSKPTVALGMKIKKYDSNLRHYADIVHKVIDNNGNAGKHHLYYFIQKE
jgi:RecA-family ATPase